MKQMMTLQPDQFLYKEEELTEESLFFFRSNIKIIEFLCCTSIQIVISKRDTFFSFNNKEYFLLLDN